MHALQRYHTNAVTLAGATPAAATRCSSTAASCRRRHRRPPAMQSAAAVAQSPSSSRRSSTAAGALTCRPWCSRARPWSLPSLRATRSRIAAPSPSMCVLPSLYQTSHVSLSGVHGDSGRPAAEPPHRRSQFVTLPAFMTDFCTYLSPAFRGRARSAAEPPRHRRAGNLV